MIRKLVIIWIGILCIGCSGCSRTKTVPSVDTAMGTIVTQTLYGSMDISDVETGKVLEIITSLEDEISVKREDSLILQINQQSEGTLFEIPEELQDVLGKCAEIGNRSNGALDVSIGQLVDLWNFDQVLSGDATFQIPEEEVLRQYVEAHEKNSFRLEDGQLVLTGNGNLNLGAVGKGLACDRIYRYLETQKDITAGIVAVGGSVVTYGQKPDATQYRIGIVHPRKDGAYLGYLSVSGGSFVSTSGDYERYVEQDGIRYHHILDPHTGYPADQGLCAVTIVCHDGLLSDALSTACFVLGEEEGMRLLEQYDAEGLFVLDNMEIRMTPGMETFFQLTE